MLNRSRVYALVVFMLGCIGLVVQPTSSQQVSAQSKREAMSQLANLLTCRGDHPQGVRVAAALTWFADHQARGGYWSPDFYRNDSRRAYQRVEPLVAEDWGLRGPGWDGGLASMGWGITALVVQAMVRSGSSHTAGPMQSQVAKARGWLLASQKQDGSFGRIELPNGLLSHCWAVEAIAGLQKAAPESAQASALTRGARFILSKLNGDGALSVAEASASANVVLTASATLALASAKDAGFTDPNLASALNNGAKWMNGVKGSAALWAGDETCTSVFVSALALAAQIESGVLASGKREAMAIGNAIVDALPKADSAGGAPGDVVQAAAVARLGRSHTAMFRNAAYARISRALTATQRGYAEFYGEAEQAPQLARPEGRKLLQEHGSWEPGMSGELYVLSEAGGRVFVSAMATLGLIAMAEGNATPFTLDVRMEAGASGGRPTVEWPTRLGESPQAMMGAFWTMMRDQIDLQASVLIDVEGWESGKGFVARGKVAIQKVARYSDWTKGTESEDGEWGITVLLTTPSGRSDRYLLNTVTGEELLRDSSFKWVNPHAQVMQDRNISEQRLLNGPKDPRLPWYSMTMRWFDEIPLSRKAADHYLGFAVWRSSVYSWHPVSHSEHLLNGVWFAASDEILYDGRCDGILRDTQAKLCAAYCHGDLGMAEVPDLQFWVDSYLIQSQRDIRIALYRQEDVPTVTLDDDWMKLLEKDGPAAVANMPTRERRLERRRAMDKRINDARKTLSQGS